MNFEKIRADKYIIDAFIQLTKHEPIERITVKNIVEATAINRRTFYDYFYSKENLIEKIDSLLLNTFFNSFKKSSFEEIQLYKQQVEEGKAIAFNIEICECLKNHQYYYMRRFENEQFVQHFSERLSIALKPFSHDSSMNTYLASGTIGCFKEWLKSDCQKPVEDVAVSLANAGFYTILKSIEKQISI